MCNNEPPLCLSKYFAFCPEESAHSSERSLSNAVPDTLEKAMSPPIGVKVDYDSQLFFSLSFFFFCLLLNASGVKSRKIKKKM